MRGSRTVIATMVACCFSAGCLARVDGRQQSGPAAREVAAPYLTTRDHVGHELVKTEQFVVPVGTAVLIEGLEFESGVCRLTPHQERIMAQVFNALEEITENTVGDTDVARVAEHKKMQFEIRAFSDNARSSPRIRTLSERCAEVVRAYLLDAGTPAWRLTARGLGAPRCRARTPASGGAGETIKVVFVRMR